MALYERTDTEEGTALSLKAVVNALCSVSIKWYDIGVQLGIPPLQLHFIEADRPATADRMHTMLDCWMRNATHPLPSWKGLVDALRDPGVGESRLAMELEERYCGPGDHRSLVAGIELFQLESQLECDTISINDDFAILVSDTRESMGRIELRKLTATLTHSKINLAEEVRMKVVKAESVSEMFSHLNRRWSWFNYHLLEDIINDLGDQNDCARLEKYKQKFAEYGKRRVVELPPDAYKGTSCDNNDDDVELAVKVDRVWTNYYVKDADTFRSSLAAVLGVRKHHLRLIAVHEGCVLLTFLIPSSVAQTSFPLSRSQEKELGDDGVSKLSCTPFIKSLKASLKAEGESLQAEGESLKAKIESPLGEKLQTLRKTSISDAIYSTSTDPTLTTDNLMEVVKGVEGCWYNLRRTLGVPGSKTDEISILYDSDQHRMQALADNCTTHLPTRWRDIGFQLGILDSKLNVKIRGPYQTDHHRMQALADHNIMHHYTTHHCMPSWKAIPGALKWTKLQKQADEVTTKYVKGLKVTNTLAVELEPSQVEASQINNILNLEKEAIFTANHVDGKWWDVLLRAKLKFFHLESTCWNSFEQ